MSNYPYDASRGSNYYDRSPLSGRPSHGHQGGGWGRTDNRDNRAPRNDYYGRSHFIGNGHHNRNNRDAHRDDNHYRNRGSNRDNDHRRGQDNERKRSAPAPADAIAPGETKRPNKISSADEGLTPEQLELKNRIKELCDISYFSYLNKQAFIRPEGWDEKMKGAAEYTKTIVVQELKKKLDAVAEYDEAYDSEDDMCYTPVGVDQGNSNNIKIKHVSDFIDKLPSCLLMNPGFHIDHNSSEGLDKICMCPCFRSNDLWRKKQGIDIDKAVICDYRVSTPYGLIAHVRKMGGVVEEKTKGGKTPVGKKSPLDCEFHYAVRVFLEELYKDYNGDIGHKALYFMGDTKYKQAENAADHRKKIQLESLGKENAELKSKVAEKEKEMERLGNINKDLYDKVKRFESELDKLGIVEEEKQELTEEMLREYKEDIQRNFGLLKHLVSTGGANLNPSVERMKIFVAPDPSGKCSFLLQDFLDNLSDLEGKDDSVFERVTDFKTCHRVLFGDILSLDEVKEMNQTQRKEHANITAALISEWNVTYTKNEVGSKPKKGKGQKKDDTAIDQGGPSRQFLSDCFLQMQTLFIPVFDERVAIFQQETAGAKRGKVMEIIPRLDDELRLEIKSIFKKAGLTDDSPDLDGDVEKTMDRIKLYSRAMGRMLLHAFVCGYPVSSAVMSPFFMNLMLRGIMPGDSRYKQSDILKDIDEILMVNADDSISFYVGSEDYLDNNGNQFTSDTVFSEFIPDNFIKNRSVVLGGLMDGLSFLGKKDASEKLEEGSGLSTFLRHVPIEAISKILFARPNLSFEDVKEALCPVFSQFDSEGLWEDHPLEQYAKLQKEFYETEFLTYIEAEAEKDCKFLSEFVECCTGSSCLPFVVAGGDPFQIKVEFNLDRKPKSLPYFHTCTMEHVLPGHIYKVCTGDEFREKMTMVIRACRNQFYIQ